MPDYSSREVQYRVVPDAGDHVIEKRGGYEAPSTPFALPEMPAGPAQGASPAGGADAQSQTTSTSDD
ncbi:hypothetical protein [Amycolatopsis rifamycinica]|uniref:ATP-grasp-modified RiPP n=1 Tax=Amycolatopsis rifamycinica TaxID=287986 RepID=A0A066TS87_9PSEU|nr:hypothetical protein [Amycolatopsis rifamycinica]KDN16402.1 hypothetical protein DV20_41040 [Amycolatopsis rifamycinica]